MHTRIRAAAAVAVGALIASAMAMGVPLAAHADGTASITGTVTLPAGVTVATANPQVFVYAADDESSSVTDGVEVDASGVYTVSGLPAGTYKLLFTASGGNVATEWWQDSLEFDTAQTVTLADGGSAVADATLDLGASVSGVVSGGISREGFGIALAYRQEPGGWWEERLAPIESVTGAYTLDGLRPGTYVLLFSDDDYLDKSISGLSIGVLPWAEWWNDAMTFDTATQVTVGAQTTQTLPDVDLDHVNGEWTWPELTGTPKVGYALKTTAGPWPAGTDVQYRWFADDIEIAGARSATLTLSAAVRGKHIYAGVYGRLPGESLYQARYSNVTPSVAYGTLTAGTPTISGKLRVGKKLTVNRHTWTAGTSFSYQWYANGKKIKGATKSTYTLKSAQRGKKITVKVTGKKTGYLTVTKTSKSTSKVR